MVAEPKESEFEPLGLTCTSTECEQNLHCFRATRKMRKQNEAGKCRSCGVELVDWERVRKRDSADAAYTVEMMKLERIRHEFWHKSIDEKAMNHARRKGRSGLRVAAEHIISKRVAPAEPKRDGMQTPYDGHVVHYAQHATATCCRKCVEYWHGIEMGRELTEGELRYLTDLVLLFIDQRLPDLKEQPEKVPNVRRKK